MGREIKRVPLDFDWPIDKVWQGFLRPEEARTPQCQVCDGTGSSLVARLLHARWYGQAPFKPEETGSTPFTIDHPSVMALAIRNTPGDRVRCVCGAVIANAKDFSDHILAHPEWKIDTTYGRERNREAQRLCDHFNSHWCHHIDADDVQALLDEDRLDDFTRYTSDDPNAKRFPNGRLEQPNGRVPTPIEVNEWSLNFMGHDSINAWVVITAKCQRLGVPSKCEVCDGHGEIGTPAVEWESTEPPEGEGWQVWETVSEGSPVTPVLPTKEALIDYLVSHGDSWDAKRGDGGWSRKAAESFVNSGWAPTMIMSSAGLRAPRDGMDT